MLLNFEHIYKSYGDRQILDDVTFYLDPGDRMGVIGVNGGGKSTLLKVAAGEEAADKGAVSRDPNVRIAYLSQDLRDEPGLTVLEQVLSGQSSDTRELKEYEAKEMLSKLGICDYDKKMSELSGGQRKRVALVSCLVSPADVLILDEPTNHLDALMISWLEDYLSSFRGAILFVTHDRYFLEALARKTAELSFGRFFVYDGGYTAYLDGKAQREEMEAASERKRQSVLRRELIWMLQGPCARGTKSRERIERYEKLRDKQPPQTEETSFEIRAVSSRLGKKTIELKGISKSFGENIIIRPFDYILQRDDRIGIIGPNGSGKSTILNMIAGTLSPDSGEIIHGDTVKIGFFSQHAAELDVNQRAIDYVKEHGDRIETKDGFLTASKLMEMFLFSGDIQYRQIGRLSGGEKRRLFLLGILASAPNVLLLDEPTNDLDIPTLRILEDYLESFPGAIISVSHDRYFLDRICSRLFTISPSHEVSLYTGAYSDYLSELMDSQKAETKKEKNVEKMPAQAREKTKKLKFSFKEQREFETIDDDIALLERKIAENKAEQEKNSSDYVKLQELMEKQNELEKMLEEKEERWVYLNELNEQISAQ